MNYIGNTKAPDMLLDVIAEVGGVLAKSKDGNSKKFWERVLGVMKFSYGYMTDLAWIVRENEALKAENQFLKHWSRELQDRLSTFDVIEQEKLNNTFEETIRLVDRKLNG